MIGKPQVNLINNTSSISDTRFVMEEECGMIIEIHTDVLNIIYFS